MTLRTGEPQVLLFAAMALCASIGAQAAVTISNSPTKNMVCASGVCTPTHKSAVLNAGDLQTLLASGNVTVTTGSGSLAAETSDIDVNAPLSWSSTSTLTLDAYHSITFSKVTLVAGAGGLSFITNDGGTGGLLSFGTTGRAIFSNLAGTLTINGAAYTLVVDLATLASDIAANASGNYALAANYNAASDGTYTSSPIPTTFNGIFEGLGNTISSLSIRDKTHSANDGLFAHVGSSGTVAGLRLTNVHIVSSLGSTAGGVAAQNDGALTDDAVGGDVSGRGDGPNVGGLVGVNNGTIQNSHATDKVNDGGGLAGTNYGSIDGSYATGGITGGQSAGFVVANFGSIDSSFATGTVSGGEGDSGENGGLVAVNMGGAIANSYATGAVSCSCEGGLIGGLVGVNGQNTGLVNGTISDSYSTGAVSDSLAKYLGALVGFDQTAGDITDGYWDTTTSGITNPSGGAGNRSNDPGITGLTTTQLQSGLPTGFDSSIWGQSPSINGGLPYLLANPPP